MPKKPPTDREHKQAANKKTDRFATNIDSGKLLRSVIVSVSSALEVISIITFSNYHMIGVYL